MLRCKSFITILTIAFLLIVSLLVFSRRETHTETDEVAAAPLVTVVQTDSLVFYYPVLRTMEFVCRDVPRASDRDVIFCCAAAFTGQLLEEFTHSNIVGDHVSGGKFYRGSGKPTGSFSWYGDDGTWQFSYKDASNIVEAAKRGGCAFAQTMILHDGRIVVNAEKREPVYGKSVNLYRALAEKDGRLCVVDGAVAMPYRDFVRLLKSSEITNAVYLDMGSGWNYSWYRDANGSVNYIHPGYTRYATNWIVFNR